MSENSVKTGEDYSRDSDKLSSGDFKALEATENKKSLVGRLKSMIGKSDSSDNSNQQENKEKSEREKTTEDKLNDLFMKLEKHDGKFETIVEFQNSMNDKILDFSSQIGELRSLFVGKEKMFERIENRFSEFEDLLSEIKLDEISKNFTKINESLALMQDKSTISEETLKKHSENIVLINESLKKIKDLEKIEKILIDIKKSQENILETKEYISKMVVNCETLFEETNDSIEKIKRFDARLSNTEAISQKTEATLEVMNGKLKTKASEKQVKLLESDLKTIKKDVFKNRFKKFLGIAKDNNFEAFGSQDDTAPKTVASSTESTISTIKNEVSAGTLDAKPKPLDISTETNPPSNIPARKGNVISLSDVRKNMGQNAPTPTIESPVVSNIQNQNTQSLIPSTVSTNSNSFSSINNTNNINNDIVKSISSSNNTNMNVPPPNNISISPPSNNTLRNDIPPPPKMIYNNDLAQNNGWNTNTQNNNPSNSNNNLLNNNGPNSSANSNLNANSKPNTSVNLDNEIKNKIDDMLSFTITKKEESNKPQKVSINSVDTTKKDYSHDGVVSLSRNNYSAQVKNAQNIPPPKAPVVNNGWNSFPNDNEKEDIEKRRQKNPLSQFSI